MFSVAASAFQRVAMMTPSMSSKLMMPRRFFHASPLAWAKLNVEGLASKVDLSGQNVLVRVDLNVPLAKASFIPVIFQGRLYKFFLFVVDEESMEHIHHWR